MSRIPAIPSGPAPTNPSASVNDLRNVDLNDFLKLLITELQSQDPLDPMENSEMLQQISLIREISATDRLSDTLTTVLTGQNLATASGLIGKTVRAMSDDLREVSGVVNRVSVDTDANGGNRQLRVHIGDARINLNNIREIVQPASE